MPRISTCRLPTPSRSKAPVSQPRIKALDVVHLLICSTADHDAGKAFEKAAQIQNRNLNEPDDAANTMVDAFKVYRRESPQDAVRCLDAAIDRLTAKGNFRRAASHKESLGELYETEMHDPKRALDAYETAAAWYDGDNAPAYVLFLLLRYVLYS
jgi:alpha-soluble NSF attachment protein